MYKLLAASIGIALLTGCSSTPEVSANRDQYCYADKTITNTNGTINSETVVQCSDRPEKNWQIKLGISGDCRPQYHSEIVDGYHKEIMTYACKDRSGRWHRIPNTIR
jgi:uncharacterized protein YcfL